MSETDVIFTSGYLALDLLGCFHCSTLTGGQRFTPLAIRKVLSS